MQSLISSLTKSWGLEAQWERAQHCTFVSAKGQVCASRPVPQCPLCGGLGVLYDPPMSIMGFFANQPVRVTIAGFGQTLETTPTFLVSPTDDESKALLIEGVVRLFEGKVELRDKFTIKGVKYVADGPSTTPSLADENLAWRIPLKRLFLGSRGGA